MPENVLINFQSQIDGINKAVTALEKLITTDKALGNEFVKNNDKAKKSIESTNTSLNSLNNTLRNIAGSVGVAFGVQALVAYGKEAVNLKAKMESLQNTFNFAFGSAKDGALAMDFVRTLSNKLGLELLTTADAFKKFSAAANLSGIQASETKKIFAQVSTAVTAMGLSGEDANGVFLALSQIISKGTVQAEELRGQIGERLPGAFNLAAKAMGVTTKELNKMLEQGQVLSVDFLPKFAQQMEDTFGSAVPAAMESTQAKLNRLENAFADFKTTLGVLIADSGIIDFFSTLTKGIQQSTSALGLEGSLIDEEAAKRASDVIKEVEFSAKKLGNTFEVQANNRIFDNYTLLSQQKEELDQLQKLEKQRGFVTQAERDEMNILKVVIATKEKEIPILEEAIKGQQKKTEVVKEATKEEKAAIEKAIKEEKAALEDLEKFQIKNIQNERDRIIAESEYEIKNLKGSEETKAKLKEQIQIEANRKLTELYIEDRQHQEDEHEKAIKSFKKKIDDEREKRKDFNKEMRDFQQKAAKEEIEQEKEEPKIYKESQQLKYDIAAEAFNGLAELAIGARDHDLAIAKELLDSKIIGEEEYNKRVKKIKREQAIIDKAQALFNIAIRTAQNIVEAKLNPVLTPLLIALGAIQAGIVIAKPIPFNKGTKRVPGVDMGMDSVHAILRPGEKVFTTERSREYEPILDSIFDAKIPAARLNKLAKGDAGGMFDEYMIQRSFKSALRDGIVVKNFPKQTDSISLTEYEFLKRRGA